MISKRLFITVTKNFKTAVTEVYSTPLFPISSNNVVTSLRSRIRLTSLATLTADTELNLTAPHHTRIQPKTPKSTRLLSAASNSNTQKWKQRRVGSAKLNGANKMFLINSK